MSLIEPAQLEMFIARLKLDKTEIDYLQVNTFFFFEIGTD